MSRAKTIGFIIIGLFLFSGSMMFLFDFQSPEVAKASPIDFIKVKDGYISYLDVKGYNFQFACEINQILILESEVQLQAGQIIVTSNNSFGITELIFNETVNGDVKFAINHQGNYQRDYWFRMHIFNRGLTHLPERNILSWETGTFDYSDMIDESFWIDQNEAGDYWLSMRFLNQVDFFIDPILSSEIILAQTTVFEENNMIVPYADNLIANFKMNEGLGTILTDSSGNGHTGSVVDSPSWSSSFNSNANYSIDFTPNDYLTINDSDDFSFGNGTHDVPFSIDAWINPDTVSGEQMFVGKNAIGGNQEYWFAVENGKLALRLWEAAGVGDHIYCTSSASSMVAGQWHHVVGVYNGNGTGQGISLFINGTEDSDAQGEIPTYTSMTNREANVTIGRYGAGGYYDGKIDEVRFWNTSLSSVQITDLYNFAPDGVTSLVYDYNSTGNWTGYLVNGSNSAYYNLDYSISNDSISGLEGDLAEHKHFFYFPHNYTFVNCTFGNGTIKTIESGFDISVYNSTYDRMNFTDTSQVTGDWIWFFLTENAIKNIILNPQWDVNGTLNNVSSVAYNVRVANGSVGVIGVDVLIRVIDLSETLLFSTTQSTGSNGWLNSSVSSTQFAHAENNTYYVTATCTNNTFIGYMVNYFLAFNDWDAPVVNNINFEDTLVELVSFSLDVSISDDYTEFEDLTVSMDYSFVSSGTLTESSSLTVSGQVYTVSLIGQVAGTTLWFQITVLDNMSNSFQSIVYQTDWIIEEEGIPAGGDGDGDGNGAPALQPAGGIPDVVLILLFGAGAVSVAVVGYAVLQRVQVRTRRVETREVVTGLGTFGRSKEDIKVTGRKPKVKKKARAKRKQK